MDREGVVKTCRLRCRRLHEVDRCARSFVRPSVRPAARRVGQPSERHRLFMPTMFQGCNGAGHCIDSATVVAAVRLQTNVNHLRPPTLASLCATRRNFLIIRNDRQLATYSTSHWTGIGFTAITRRRLTAAAAAAAECCRGN